MTLRETILMALLSVGEGSFTVFLLNEVMPWTLHTVAAVASAMAVSTALYHYNKWLKKK